MKHLLAYRFVAMAVAGRWLIRWGGRVSGWGAEMVFAVEARRAGRKSLRQLRAQRALEAMQRRRPLTGEPR